MNLFQVWYTAVPFIIACTLFLAAVMCLFINLADFAQYRAKAVRYKSHSYAGDYARNARQQARNVRVSLRCMAVAWIWPLALLYYATRWIPGAFKAVRRELKETKEWASAE